jgi:hypothetical protein
MPSGESAAAKAKQERLRALERLKTKWLAMGPGPPPNEDDGEASREEDPRADERAALAKESVEALLCSGELLDLVKFLRDRKMSPGPGGDLTWLVPFLPPHGAEARRLLIEMAGKDVNKDLLQRWSESAGLNCPEENFEAFHTALKRENKDCADRAMLLRNDVYVKTNPEAAITATLQILAEATNKDAFHLGQQIEALPPETDFEAVGSVLLQHDPGRGKFPGAWQKLFVAWGQHDFEAAADHVFNHQDSLPPEYLGYVAQGHPDMEWVKTLPAGPYLDAAAAGIAAKFYYDPALARTFAVLIGDPVVRANCIREIEAMEETRRSGEPY